MTSAKTAAGVAECPLGAVAAYARDLLCSVIRDRAACGLYPEALDQVLWEVLVRVPIHALALSRWRVAETLARAEWLCGADGRMHESPTEQPCAVSGIGRLAAAFRPLAALMAGPQVTGEGSNSEAFHALIAAFADVAGSFESVL